VWHPPNATFRHAEKCWDVTYHSNSYGARDVERARRSAAPRRHVVLGDSFVEGYGLPDGDRLTDRLSASTHEEFLNFGTGGAFGTIQELALYRTLASNFDHSDVLLFVLPMNDFSDNDPRYWSARRYRPYLRSTGNGYETYYTVPFERRDTDTLSSAMIGWNRLSNRLVAVNLVRQAIERRIHPRIQPATYESYPGHSQRDVDVMAEAIRELGAAASGRAVRVFLIPVQTDLDGYINDGTRYDLPERLTRTIGSSANVTVIDLLPHFVRYAAQHHVPASAFFLDCDAHWSALGNAVAADAVQHVTQPLQ
jgi:lysophospholipase L1-like esterase